jgi:hypothetical protein
MCITYHLLMLEVDESAVNDEVLALVALLQLVVVDADHLQLQLALRRVLVGRELHVRQQPLRIVLVDEWGGVDE